MSPLKAGHAPDLSVFLKSLKNTAIQSSIENLISLLKRRQIHGSRPCAIATVHLLLRVVAKFKWTDVGKLITRISEVGQRLIMAQPREVVVGNMVRRVLDLIRDEANEKNQELDSDSASGVSRDKLAPSNKSYTTLNELVIPQTMFNLLSTTNSPYTTPPSTSYQLKPTVSATSLARKIETTTKDLKAEITSGIEEIIDELRQVNDQIAGYAQEHIHSNEIILTHSPSLSVQKFLLKAAEKRKFTVIMAESYPNEYKAVHSMAMGKCSSFSEDNEETDKEYFLEPLTEAGVTVILITDASIFAIMSRVNKVILATHAVIANGGLIADAGAHIIAKAAKVHRTPVIVVSGVYKLSPQYPYEIESLIEYGDPGKVIPFDIGPLAQELEVDNPVYDYVPPDLVDLYITNLGAHAPSYLYRIVADHYRTDDSHTNQSESFWTS